MCYLWMKTINTSVSLLRMENSHLVIKGNVFYVLFNNWKYCANNRGILFTDLVTMEDRMPVILLFSLDTTSSFPSGSWRGIRLHRPSSFSTCCLLLHTRSTVDSTLSKKRVRNQFTTLNPTSNKLKQIQSWKSYNMNCF